MRSSIRRAERCWRTVGDRYTAYLRTLTDEEFHDELRRTFAGYTREQFMACLRSVPPDEGEDMEKDQALADKLFEGRKRL